MKFAKKFKQYRHYFLLIILALAIIAFLVFENQRPNSPGLGDEFKISVGETVSIKDSNIKIKVLKVNDSRCPATVNCIIQGQASVSFNVLRDDVVLGKFLRSERPDNSHLFLNGYNIYILKVDPYPIQADSIEDSDYEISMLVTK